MKETHCGAFHETGAPQEVRPIAVGLEFLFPGVVLFQEVLEEPSHQGGRRTASRYKGPQAPPEPGGKKPVSRVFEDHMSDLVPQYESDFIFITMIGERGVHVHVAPRDGKGVELRSTDNAKAEPALGPFDGHGKPVPECPQQVSRWPLTLNAEGLVDSPREVLADRFFSSNLGCLIQEEACHNPLEHADSRAKPWAQLPAQEPEFRATE